jgi:hypothetical protein
MPFVLSAAQLRAFTRVGRAVDLSQEAQIEHPLLLISKTRNLPSQFGDPIFVRLQARLVHRAEHLGDPTDRAAARFQGWFVGDGRPT